jgi:hypothetical protein
MIRWSSKFLLSQMRYNILAHGGDNARYNLGPWTQSIMHHARKGLVKNTTYKCFMYGRSNAIVSCALSLVAIPWNYLLEKHMF